MSRSRSTKNLIPLTPPLKPRSGGKLIRVTPTTTSSSPPSEVSAAALGMRFFVERDRDIAASVGGAQVVVATRRWAGLVFD